MANNPIQVSGYFVSSRGDAADVQHQYQIYTPYFRRVISSIDPIVESIVQHELINVSSSGSTLLVPAQGTNIEIAVLSGLIIALDTVNCSFESQGAGATAITGPLPLTPGGSGFQIPYCPHANFRTLKNEGLNINLTAAITVGGWLVWAPVQ